MKTICSAFIFTTLFFSMHVAYAAPDHRVQIENLINDKKYLTAAENRGQNTVVSNIRENCVLVPLNCNYICVNHLSCVYEA